MRFKITAAATCFLVAASAIVAAYAIRQSNSLAMDSTTKPIDPGLAGSWETVGKLEGHEFQLIFTFDGSGQFSRRYFVDDGGTIDRGRDFIDINAGKGLTAGEWRYDLIGTDTLKLAARGEPTLLQRVLTSEQVLWVPFARAGASETRDMLTGKWKASFQGIGSNWEWTIDIGSGLNYHSHLEADDTGSVAAQDGKWEMWSKWASKPASGSYRVLSFSALELDIWPFGDIVLNRKL